MLAIKCFAGANRDEGRLYLASLIHLYVSLRFVVSNGGLPNSIVYLFEGKGKSFYTPTCVYSYKNFLSLNVKKFCICATTCTNSCKWMQNCTPFELSKA